MAEAFRPQVLLASFYDRSIIADPLDRLRGFADVRDVNFGRCLTEEELDESLAGMHVSIAADEKYPPRLIDRATDLVLIAREGTGYDGVDVEAATVRGILVTNAPVVHACTANLVIGLMIGLIRKVPQCDRDVRADRWTERSRWLCPDLTGMTLGILGFGLVGREVAKRAVALGMKVLAYNRSDVTEPARELGVEVVSLDQVLSYAEVITVHIRHTEKTTGMFNAQLLAKMKKGAYFVNTSRGGIVDENALLEALRGGHLAGAALDVFAEEPPAADHPLLKLENVLCSPHIAGETTTTMRQAVQVTVNQVLDCFSGKKPDNLINPDVWDTARLHRLMS